jgi:hypothetical protein
MELAAQLACSCQKDTATELLTALGFLRLMSEQVSMRSRQSAELPAVVYAAGMQLALAGFRAASRTVEKDPEDWAGASLHVSLTVVCMVAYFTLKPCAGILSGLCYAAEIQQMEGGEDGALVVNAEQQVLLESPHFIQGVAVMMVMTACTDLILATAGAAFRSSSSNGGSNPGSSNGGGSSDFGGSNGSSGGGGSGVSNSDGGNSSGGGTSFGFLADATTETELQQKMHELGAQVNMQQCSSSNSNSSVAAKQQLYDWKSNVVGDPDVSWEIASSRHQLLPEPFKRLLQLLGCNSKAALWGACLMFDVIAPFDLALPLAQELYTNLVEARHCMLLQVSVLLLLVVTVTVAVTVTVIWFRICLNTP